MAQPLLQCDFLLFPTMCSHLSASFEVSKGGTLPYVSRDSVCPGNGVSRHLEQEPFNLMHFYINQQLQVLRCCCTVCLGRCFLTPYSTHVLEICIHFLNPKGFKTCHLWVIVAQFGNIFFKFRILFVFNIHDELFPIVCFFKISFPLIVNIMYAHVGNLETDTHIKNKNKFPISSSGCTLLEQL